MNTDKKLAAKPSPKKATKPAKPAVAKVGRPKAIPDVLPTAELVERMRQIGCTINEIAEMLGVHRHTITNNYWTKLIKGRATLKVNLRRAQVAKALAGDGPMLKWLGIQYLKQHNKILLETDDQTPLQFDPANLEAMRKAGLIFHLRQQEEAAEAARNDRELLADMQFAASAS